MKHMIKFWSLLGIASAFVTTTAFPQMNVISIDENGNGFFNGAAIPGGLIAADPSGGVAGPVLLYNIPGAPLTIGDVLLNETAAGTTNLSDVVRIWTNNQVIFYSDRETGAGGDADLADISGLPAQLLANRVTIFETGVEGNNGAVYTPLIGQPGSDNNPLGQGPQYQIISDVPEPGSALLASLGGGLLLLLRWRRQRR